MWLLSLTLGFACTEETQILSVPGQWDLARVPINGSLVVLFAEFIDNDVEIEKDGAPVLGTWETVSRPVGLIVMSFTPSDGWDETASYRMITASGVPQGTPISVEPAVTTDAPDVVLTDLSFGDTVLPGESTIQGSCGSGFSGPNRTSSFTLDVGPTPSDFGALLIAFTDASGNVIEKPVSFLSADSLGTEPGNHDIVAVGAQLYANCLRVQWIDPAGIVTNVGDPVCGDLPSAPPAAISNDTTGCNTAAHGHTALAFLGLLVSTARRKRSPRPAALNLRLQKDSVLA